MDRQGRYIPGPVSDEYNPSGIEDEFHNIQRSLHGILDGNFEVLHKVPEKLQTGMLVYADGTDWNPGSGEGWYTYKSDGEWYLLADLCTNGAWEDNLTSLSTGKANPSATPAWSAFGPSGGNNQWNFAIGDEIQLAGFHIKHDIKQGSLIYPHIHWSSNGVNTGLVRWELTFTYAAGHNQANFTADTVITLEQAGAGTAWRHMIVEASAGQAITAPEVDSIIIMKIKRIAPSTGSNTDNIFGLFVDLHYERERLSTKSKAPDFYS